MSLTYKEATDLERIAEGVERIANALTILTHHTTGWLIHQSGYWYPPEEKKDDHSS